MTALALFVSTFLLVMALGAQSLMVNNGLYLGAFSNSICIGAGNLVLFKLVPNSGAWEIAAFLSGGPLGIVAAMWLFRRFHKRPEDKHAADDLAMAAHVLEKVQRNRQRESA